MPGIILFIRPILISLGMLAYFIWLQSGVLARLNQVPEHPDPALGLTIAIIQLLTLAALWFKAPLVQARVEAGSPAYRGPGQVIPNSGGALLSFVAVLGYMGLISFLSNLEVIHSFGLTLQGIPTWWDGFGFAYLFCMMVLNAYFVLIAVFPAMEKTKARRWLRPHENFPATTEWIADIILATFGALVYTITWEKIASAVLFQAQDRSNAILEYFGAALFFSLIYLAINPLATAEEWLIQRPRWARLASGAVYIAIIATAILGIRRL